MFHSNGELYLLYKVVSNKNNPLHNKIVNTTCDLELFEVGKPGVFSATRNSVYTFYRIIPEIVAAAKMGDSQNVGE